jgi:hypothetical protein
MRNPGARDNSGGLENAIQVRGIIPEAWKTQSKCAEYQIENGRIMSG